MGWMHTARFLTTAAQLHHLPPIDVPEIAFVGRSNAGKSTCINTLTQQKQLAFASKKPGRLPREFTITGCQRPLSERDTAAYP